MFQWGHDFSAVDTSCSRTRDIPVPAGFNGATTFQPWIPEVKDAMLANLVVSMGPRLFSRGYEKKTHRECRVLCEVSMGPRLFSRGYAPEPVRVGRRVPGFNGATTFQPWIPAFWSLIEALEVVVSMGPRLFSRGYPTKLRKGISLKERFNGATTFQPWIQGSAVQAYCAVGAVSMGPRLFSRGYKIGSDVEASEPIVVSMGPRLFSRGYPRLWWSTTLLC